MWALWLLLGAVLGACIIGMLVGGKRAEINEDATLLDFLAVHGLNLMPSPDGTWWGVGDAASGDMFASGRTPREAIRRLIEKASKRG